MTTLKSIIRFITLTSLLSCIGCAFGTREVLLKNSVISSSDTTTAPRTHGVCFDGFSDERIQNNIGHVQNGYGMHTAEVVAQNNVAQWINTELTNQLTAAGYVVRRNCPQDSAALVVGGKIVKVYTTAYMTYLGEVTIDAMIKDRNRKLLERTYSGHKKSGANWAATSESFRDVLQQSLDMAISHFISDIDSLDRIDFSPTPAHETAGLSPEAPVAPLQLSDTSVARYLQNSSGIECPEKSGTVQVISGERSASGIKSVMDTVRLQLNRLYRERYELNPSLSGDLCLFFEIDGSGKVDNIIFLQNTLNDKPMEEKLTGFLASYKFSKRKNKADVTRATCRLTFTEESAKSAKGAMVALLAILAIIPAVISIINLSRM